jgi:hypothetical protein
MPAALDVLSHRPDRGTDDGRGGIGRFFGWKLGYLATADTGPSGQGAGKAETTVQLNGKTRRTTITVEGTEKVR